jgi:DNA-binding HxlR family transcriptional regulator
MTGQRTYGQRCGLALSLDLLGERWTLLVLRELSRGPKRFKDLLEALDGIGTNLLSSRLKTLEQAGVAEKIELPSPASGTAYSLTERGRSLQPILEDLALWGFGLMPPLDERPDLTTRASWAAMTMLATMDRDPRPAPDGLFAFSVDDEDFWVEVRDGRSALRDGVPQVTPDVHLTTNLESFLMVTTGSAGLDEVDAKVAGDGERLGALLETFRLPVEMAQTAGA